jgi:pimeloyl-ACP methyl ester carboxylesterase
MQKKIASLQVAVRAGFDDVTVTAWPAHDLTSCRQPHGGPNRRCIDATDRRPRATGISGETRTLGPRVFVRQMRALQTRPDQQDTLRRIAVHTPALCGRDDALCPIHRHEKICEPVPGATLEFIDHAGDLPTF